MTPGRELDLIVAEKVMGWKMLDVHKRFVIEKHLIAPGAESQPHTICEYFENGYVVGPILPFRLPHYSTSIEAAWEVVEKLLREHEFELAKTTRQKYVAAFIGGPDETGEHPIFRALGDTAPHAICLAALKAVEVDV